MPACVTEEALAILVNIEMDPRLRGDDRFWQEFLKQHTVVASKFDQSCVGWALAQQIIFNLTNIEQHDQIPHFIL